MPVLMRSVAAPRSRPIYLQLVRTRHARRTRRDPIHLNHSALHRPGRFCVTQEVRGNTAPLARAAGAALGKGACRPLSNPLLVASGEAIETSPAFHPGKRSAPFDHAFLLARDRKSTRLNSSH